MMRYCPTCDTIQELRVITKNETYPVKGEDITIEARVAVCGTCGTEVFVRELDYDNLEKAYRIYRKRHNIVSPDDVRSLREKTGLSQREFAKRLGWSPATVNRYEKGALPSPAHNTVLRRLMQPEGFQEFIAGSRRGDKNTTTKKDGDILNYKLPVTITLCGKEYVAHCELLRATATGDTPDEALKNLKEAIDEMVDEFGWEAVFQDISPEMDIRILEVSV